MVFRTVFGNKIAILKRNPWMKINAKRAKKSELWASGPPWTGNPAARPPGVKALNDIFKFVSKHVKGYTVRDRVEVIGRVMDEVHTYRSSADITGAIDMAIKELAPMPAKMTIEQRATARLEAHARVPSLEALAKALGA